MATADILKILKVVCTSTHSAEHSCEVWISNLNIIIYLETKFRSNPKILYFGDHFGFKMATIANQNGRNMVQHILLPVNIHFHWNLFIFEFLTIFWIFILAAILNILKTKSTTLSDDLFLCQVPKGSAAWSEFKIVYLGYHGNILHFDFFNPSKAATHYGWYSYKVWWSLMKEIQKQI
jgi:hypothetical protein